MYFPNRLASNKGYDDRYKEGRDGQRANWHQNDYDYDDRRRSRTSTSDDRSYFNDRGRRSRDPDYDDKYFRDDSRRRSRSPMRKKRSPDPPSNKLILTSLPPNIDRDSMNIILSKHGFNPIDVRVIKKNTDSGGLRSFGFIDFNTVEEAKSYVKYTKGVLRFDDGFETRIEFARENDPNFTIDKKTQGTSDWFCAKCSINNFNRRTLCFKCGTSREESDALDQKGYTYIGSMPCDTLLVRELPITADEYQILMAFSCYSNVPIQRVQISNSKKYCFMQLRSIEDANYLLTTFNRTVPTINGCTVIITFSRVSLNKILLTESVNAIKSQAGVSINQVHEDPTNTAALLAQNAIQMTQMGRFDPHGRQSISTPLGVFPLYPRPDSRLFHLDSTTGYFYDPNGFYYDPKTGFYFNNSTQIWCFWTTKFSTYIPVEGHEPELRKKLQLEERALYTQDESAEANNQQQEGVAAEANPDQNAESSKKKKVKDEDPLKPKSALEIQKEMDRWAKKQEKIKMAIKKPEQTSAYKELPLTKAWSEEDESASDIGDSMAKKRLDCSHSTYGIRVFQSQLFRGEQRHCWLTKNLALLMSSITKRLPVHALFFAR